MKSSAKSEKVIYFYLSVGTFAIVYLGSAKFREKGNKEKKIAIKRIKTGLFLDGLDMSAIREIKYLKV
jgi:cyclin-dependent kinase 7